MEKKPEEVKKGAPEYMNTYGDMVTLLLCFFVLLFAMSTVDAAKFEAMAASFMGMPISINMTGGKESIKDLYGNGIMQMPSVVRSQNASSNMVQNARLQQAQQEMQQMTTNFKTYFAEQNINNQVKAEITDQGVLITFTEGILFDKGRANLKPEAIPVLDMVATELSKYPDSAIQIEGHTDSDPINTPQYPSNWYLSSARAIAVLEFFVNQKGYDPAQIGAMGKGEYAPVAPNDTPENKAKNRRVEILVKSKYMSENAGER